VVLALPEIERDLCVAFASVIWVIIGYLLVITMLATQVRRLGDMFGPVRIYEAGFLVFDRRGPAHGAHRCTVLEDRAETLSPGRLPCVSTARPR
jgi:hypothetical protein